MSDLNKRDEFVLAAMKGIIANIDAYRPSIVTMAKQFGQEPDFALGLLAVGMADATLDAYEQIKKEENNAQD